MWSEQLQTDATADRCWVRLHRVPELFDMVKEGAAAAHGGAQPSSPMSAPPPPPPPLPPSSSYNDTAGLPDSASRSAPSGAASPPSKSSEASASAATEPESSLGARVVAAPPRPPPPSSGNRIEPATGVSMAEPPVPPPPQEQLFHLFAAGAHAPQPVSQTGSVGSSKTRPSGGFWPFSKRKGSAGPEAPNRSVFGLPLELAPLDAKSGVPEVLCAMRRLLFENNGHLVEGIFRVSPGASSLQDARRLTEAGQLAHVKEPECLSQLIKHWFRDLPESIFTPCLRTIVDGPPPHGDAAYGELLGTLLPVQRATVEWLLRLFADIVAHEATNRMTFKSLATVFAPNLVDPPPSVPPLLALEINRRVMTFVERLVEHEVASGCLAGPRAAPS